MKKFLFKDYAQKFKVDIDHWDAKLIFECEAEDIEQAKVLYEKVEKKAVILMIEEAA